MTFDASIGRGLYVRSACAPLAKVARLAKLAPSIAPLLGYQMFAVAAEQVKLKGSYVVPMICSAGGMMHQYMIGLTGRIHSTRNMNRYRRLKAGLQGSSMALRWGSPWHRAAPPSDEAATGLEGPIGPALW